MGVSCVGWEINFLEKLKDDRMLKGHVPHIVEGEEIYVGGSVDSTECYYTLHDACAHHCLVISPIGKKKHLCAY